MPSVRKDLTMVKYKHLTLDERYAIQHMLEEKESFAAIAKKLGRDRTTISKEVRAHIVFKQSGCMGCAFNDCANRTRCGSRFFCTKQCEKCIGAKCGQCMQHCDQYKKEICGRHTSKPYVCNGCSDRPKCTLEKRLYSATFAQREYDDILSEARSGACITETEALALDAFITPLIQKGQSIHHIVQSNPGELMYSEKTIYNYIDKGIISAKNIDLPRKVRFRPRKSNHDSLKIDKKCRVGRSYKDYLEYIKQHPDCAVVQMDSVIGVVGGKCLLTIHFVKSSFMLAFLRERNTAASVVAIIGELYNLLGEGTFTSMFSVILTDNGSEFSDPSSIEFDENGIMRTRIFYCNPSSPYQKGAVENNHEFIRRVLPKGRSFDDLTQDDIDLMMNHINSYKRENLAWKSPYEIFEFLYGRDVLDKLGAKLIPANDITLLPSLLK